MAGGLYAAIGCLLSIMISPNCRLGPACTLGRKYAQIFRSDLVHLWQDGPDLIDIQLALDGE